MISHFFSFLFKKEQPKPSKSTSISTNEIRSYYRKASLWLPPKSNFRQFRLFIKRNDRMRVIKVQDRINSLENLRKHLIKHAPTDIYYTTSLWLDPQKTGPRQYSKKKPGYEFSHNVFLGSELYFDIDVPGDIDRAKVEAKKLILFLKNKGFKSFKIAFSGGKGFHVYVYDYNVQNYYDDYIEDPRLRENLTQDTKADIVNEIIKKEIIIDADITIDTRRIIRLPGTIHGKTGYLCQFIEEKNLHSFKPVHFKDVI